MVPTSPRPALLQCVSPQSPNSSLCCGGDHQPMFSPSAAAIGANSLSSPCKYLNPGTSTESVCTSDNTHSFIWNTRRSRKHECVVCRRGKVNPVGRVMSPIRYYRSRWEWTVTGSSLWPAKPRQGFLSASLSLLDPGKTELEKLVMFVCFV